MLPYNLLLLCFSSIVSAGVTVSNLPTIDFGYGVYRASQYNVAEHLQATGDFYTFSNIRFAAPPVGALRFGPPQPPLHDRSTVHDGSVGFICPQAEASYLPESRGKGPASEDCLFLDVIVPRTVLNGDHGDVPVLFWIFGGGYTLGSKTSMGDPLTFLVDSPAPVIWVAPNYRLGIFGWLGGPTFTLSAGTVPNAGLYDQRLALKWVNQYIHLFNGNKEEVTVMGDSAGAGSIMHHITAYGGHGETLFKRAIPLGPGFILEGGHAAAEKGFVDLENAAGCAGKGVECLRSINSTTLQKINEDVISVSPAPNTGYGPIIDGNYVPDMPSYLLAQGRFHKDMTLLVADDINEGYLFTNQNSTASLSSVITSISPTITNATLSAILSFFPPPSNTTPYTNNAGLVSVFTGETGFNCNRYALSAALPNTTYNLVTSILPGTHGTGPTLLFNNVTGWEKIVSAQVLHSLRRFVMNFVVTGDPNERDGSGVGDGVVWPVFASGSGLNVGGWNITLVSAVKDKEFCEWWAKGLVLS